MCITGYEVYQGKLVSKSQCEKAAPNLNLRHLKNVLFFVYILCDIWKLYLWTVPSRQRKYQTVNLVPWSETGRRVSEVAAVYLSTDSSIIDWENMYVCENSLSFLFSSLSICRSLVADRICSWLSASLLSMSKYCCSVGEQTLNMSYNLTSASHTDNGTLHVRSLVYHC